MVDRLVISDCRPFHDQMRKLYWFGYHYLSSSFFCFLEMMSLFRSIFVSLVWGGHRTFFSFGVVFLFLVTTTGCIFLHQLM